MTNELETKTVYPRVLLIPLDTLDRLEMEIKTLKLQTLETKKGMAVKDYDFFEFMDYVNLSDDFRDISIEEVHCEWYNPVTLEHSGRAV